MKYSLMAVARCGECCVNTYCDNCSFYLGESQELTDYQLEKITKIVEAKHDTYLFHTNDGEKSVDIRYQLSEDREKDKELLKVLLKEYGLPEDYK